VTARVAVAMRIDAPAVRVFDAFVREIGSWWRPSPLFPFTPGRSGRLDLEPGPDGRLVEHYDDGTAFQIGEVREWRPPHSLVLSWRLLARKVARWVKPASVRPSDDLAIEG